jgi:hypothetical protein
MPNIKISKYLRLSSPLLSSSGERVEYIDIDGSFVLSEFRNSDYMKYDREEDSWYLDIDSLVSESISNNPLFNEPSRKSAAPNIEDILGVDMSEIVSGDTLVYDSIEGSFVLKNIEQDLSEINVSLEQNLTSISDINSVISGVVTSLPSFLYTDIIPEGTGTNQITKGSIWYNTSNSIAYIYVYDGEGCQWVQI